MSGSRTLAVLAAALVVAGCTADTDDADAPRVVQLGAPGEAAAPLAPDEVPGLAGPAHTAADVEFVQGMIAHHEQALAMTALVDDRAGRDDLPLLAERMEVSQQDEIAQMTAWLAERGAGGAPEDAHGTGGHGEQPAGAHGDAHGLMPGMLTDDDLARLEAADGRDFDELFLQYMIRHHEGARVMVEELLSGGQGGQESAVFQIAQHVDSDQSVEIARMRSLLAEIAATPPG